MAVTDSHGNTLNDFSVREEENPQKLASPEHGATAKRKKKRKKINEESNEQSQVEVCPKPSVDSLFSQEGNAETAADNPEPIPKKKKIKNVGGEQQLQTSDPSIAVCVESDDTKGEGARLDDANGNGGLCPESLLDAPVPIVSHEENAEGTALNPDATAKKKRKKKILQGEQQICDLSIQVGVEPDDTKDEVSREGNVNENGGLCPQALLDTPIPIVSHEEKAEGTALNPSPTPKKKRNKKILQGAEQICDPSIRIGVKPDVANDEGSREGNVNESGGLFPQPLLDTPVPIVSHEENAVGTALNPSPNPQKKRKKILQGEEQIYDPSIRIGLEPDVAMDEGSREGDVNENGSLCPKPLLDTPVPIVSHEENAEGTALNPSSTPKKKRNKKILQGAEQICDPSIQIGVEPDVGKDEGSREGDVNENGGLCPAPLLDTPVPIVSHEENAQGTALNPSPTPKKKRRRKKKILQSEEQISDPSIQIGVERDVAKDEGSREGDVNENGGVCPKPFLDLPVPIVSHEENAEGTALNPSPTPKKKRNKKILQGAEQIYDPSIRIGVEPDVGKDEGSREGDVNKNEDLCPKPLLDTPIPVVSLGENAEATAQNPSPTPKKKSLQGAEQICDPLIRIGVEPDVTNEEGSQRGDAIGNGGLCPKNLLDAPPPIVPREENAQAAQNPSPNPKKKKENLLGAEQICDPSIRIGMESDVPKEGGQQGSEKAETSTQNPIPTPKRKRRKNVQGEQQQLQICDPSISIGVEPDVKKERAQVNANEVGVSGISEERPVPDCTVPEDWHQKMDSARKKKKALKPPGAEAESEPELKESYKTENPQQCTPDLKQKEAGANTENSGVCSKPEVAPQLYVAATTDLELKEKAELIEVNKEHPQAGSKPELESPIDMPTQTKPQKKKRKREKKKKETKPSEVHAQHPQPQPSSNHAPTVRGIIEQCPAPEGAKSNEVDGKPPETPVQGFLYPVVALPVDPTIPVQASLKDTATAIDQDLKMSEKKRKSNPIAAPSIEPTIQTGQDPPVDPATPVDPGQMTKKKKNKKSKSARKNKLLESEKHNAHPTAEAPVHKTEGPTTKKSMGRCNSEQAANTLVHRTERLTVTKSPSKEHVESSLSCGACHKIGHGLEQCKRLKRLSKDEEVCFFCGEIGHSLGKCGVSQAGGRFAKCLLCYKHGHFGYNCPESDNEKNQKVLAANGAINISHETS
ncbi:hypothetical protein VNO80_16615 [Phaseolus coccineus]|uniref:CCHC-type domain-containing protein n=1 Tax=Phaseolus coccineus TaxID=3886 RepID=A0AAN9MMP7_PHACN